jgi:hypothetical protein
MNLGIQRTKSNWGFLEPGYREGRAIFSFPPGTSHEMVSPDGKSILVRGGAEKLLIFASSGDS